MEELTECPFGIMYVQCTTIKNSRYVTHTDIGMTSPEIVSLFRRGLRDAENY